MNVLIDMLGVTSQKAGVGVYAKSMIDELVRIESNVTLFLLVQDDDPDLDYSGRTNVTMIRMRSRFLRILPIRLLFEQVLLPALLIRHRISLIHSLHYSFPIVRFGVRQIVTLHDMTFFSMPEAHLRSKVIYFRFFIAAANAMADGLIFVSESARRDCHELLGEPHGSVAVVPHGARDSRYPDIPEEAVRRVLDKYALPKAYVLYIGTIEPRKNLKHLIEAFASITKDHPHLQLVIAGKKGWNKEFEALTGLVSRFGLNGRVTFPGFIAEEDKLAILRAATVFIYPSLYEGFGLPVLEAMACGVPTITSNTSSLPEVAGQGAVLIDPRSVREIASAMTRVLSDPALREELRNRGVRQAATFSWKRAATATLAFYVCVGSRLKDKVPAASS